jgi:hypothetical protein
MAKRWVLDTETKGTGAHVVPYEKARQGARADSDLALFEFDRTPSPRRPAAPPQPLRFKVVDVMSSQVLAEDADVRETVEALEGKRSVIDVRILRWEPRRERWRLLTVGEAKALWAFRGRLSSTADDRGAEPSE